MTESTTEMNRNQRRDRKRTTKMVVDNGGVRRLRGTYTRTSEHRQKMSATLTRYPVPSYSTFHQQIAREMQSDQCAICGSTDGPLENACVHPTRWGRKHDGSLLLMGDSSSDYKRMCQRCHMKQTVRDRNEGLALRFGVPLPSA